MNIDEMRKAAKQAWSSLYTDEELLLCIEASELVIALLCARGNGFNLVSDHIKENLRTLDCLNGKRGLPLRYVDLSPMIKTGENLFRPFLSKEELGESITCIEMAIAFLEQLPMLELAIAPLQHALKLYVEARAGVPVSVIQ